MKRRQLLLWLLRYQVGGEIGGELLGVAQRGEGGGVLRPETVVSSLRCFHPISRRQALGLSLRIS